jgi:UDP-glucose 4-epimerase
MSKIIVLGGSGFIGGHLISKLLENNENLIALKHKNPITLNCNTFNGNILDSELLDDVIEENDLVINLVGQIHENSTNFIDANVFGNLNILESCRKKKSNLILISSTHVYGNYEKLSPVEDDKLIPKSQYGIIKLVNEKICKHYSSTYNLNVTILRLSNVYGPSKISGIIAQLFNSIGDKKNSVTLDNNGNQRRDFLYIDDAVSGIIESIKKIQPGFNIFNISTGIRTSMMELAEKIEKIVDDKIPIQLSSQTPNEESIWANNEKAKLFLNFSPKISMDQGIFLIFQSFKKRN